MTATARETFEEAIALEKSGELDKALVSYLRAQELAPRDSEIAYRTASALLQAGYLEEAQSQLRRIVFTEPDNLDARASLGNCQLLMGDTENAGLNFRDVLTLVPDNRNALYGYASVCIRDDRPHEAAETAKRLVHLLPGSPAVLALFAETQAKTGQSAAAIAAFRKALKVDPDHLPALLGLSEVLFRRKRYDEVIELTIRANSISPADPLPLELLSDALAGKGAADDAYEAAEAALKLSPASLSCLVRLSVLSRKLGNFSAALRYALEAHDLNEGAQEPLNALGAALASLKYAEEARSVLTGLSAGRGLDDRVRKVAENLVASSIGHQRENESSSERRKLEGFEETLPAAAVQSEAGSLRPVSETVKSEQSRPSDVARQDDGPEPKILGLQRRDRT